MAEEVQDEVDEQLKGFFNNTFDGMVKTHEKINHTLSGEVEKLELGYAKVVLETNELMQADHVGLIHGGFIFSGADYAAMLAVNEPNVVLAGCNCMFLAPVRVGDKVVFEATEQQKEGRKRNVSVRGFVHEIKVFEGEFKTVITEHHVLRLDLMKNIDTVTKSS